MIYPSEADQIFEKTHPEATGYVYFQVGIREVELDGAYSLDQLRTIVHLLSLIKDV